MAITPIFDLLESSENVEFFDMYNAYGFVTQAFGSLTDAQMQILINEASQLIYDYTKYYPKQTSKTITINPDAGGKGNIGYKLPESISSLTTTDYRFEGVTFDYTKLKYYRNGEIELQEFYYDSNNGVKIFPFVVTLVLDYGFDKATQLPEQFKLVCVQLVVHLLSVKHSQATTELTESKDGDINQKYNNPRFVTLSILKQLLNVRI